MAGPENTSHDHTASIIFMRRPSHFHNEDYEDGLEILFRVESDIDEEMMSIGRSMYSGAPKLNDCVWVDYSTWLHSSKRHRFGPATLSKRNCICLGSFICVGNSINQF